MRGIAAGSATQYILIVLCSTFCAVSASARKGPEVAEAGEANALQIAVDAASAGEVVLVTGGVYRLSAPLTISKGITLRSENGPDETIVDADGSMQCLILNHSDAVVDGFTIRNGYSKNAGGGVDLKAGSIQNCIVRDNESGNAGGGIYVAQGGEVRNCLLMGNTADKDGGGIYVLPGGVVESSTIVDNEAGKRGGGVSLTSTAVLRNTIVYFNSAPEGQDCDIRGNAENISYCCASSSLPGVFNITDAPQFEGRVETDYRLREGSPCIDAGTNVAWMDSATDLAGRDRMAGLRVDMGAYESESTFSSTEDTDGDGASDWEEYVANTDPESTNSHLRIVSGEQETGTGLKIGVYAGANRAVEILASDEFDGPATVIGTLRPDSEAITTWIDENLVGERAQRFYRIRVRHDGQSVTNEEQWAAFVQRREPGKKYLITVPVDLGPQSRLNSDLGDQLADGLHAGETIEDGDKLMYRSSDGQWHVYYLVLNAQGRAIWWDADAGRQTNVRLEPGTGLWIERRGEGESGYAVFFGRTVSNPPSLEFTTEAGGWTLFGWAYPKPLRHEKTSQGGHSAAQANQLGFAHRGKGGPTVDPRRRNEWGDQIWVWKDDEWKGYYWLMDGLGSQWDGRWWDNTTRDFADFSLEPGNAYYYWHGETTGGTNFVWVPPTP